MGRIGISCQVAVSWAFSSNDRPDVNFGEQPVGLFLRTPRAIPSADGSLCAITIDEVFIDETGLFERQSLRRHKRIHMFSMAIRALLP